MGGSQIYLEENSKSTVKELLTKTDFQFVKISYLIETYFRLTPNTHSTT